MKKTLKNNQTKKETNVDRGGCWESDFLKEGAVAAPGMIKSAGSLRPEPVPL